MSRTPSIVATFALFVAAVSPAQSQPPVEEPFELVGVVRGPDRKPMAKATVTVRWRTHPELPGLCGLTLGDSSKATNTDDRGRFRVKVPVAGPFEMFAANADASLMSIRKFPVMAGGFVECELEKAPWIGGVVVDSDADGAPMPGFELDVVPFQQTWARHRGCGSPLTKYRVKTDENGKWRLPFPSAYLREPFWEPYLVLVAVDPSKKLGGASLLMPDESCQRLVVTVSKQGAVDGVVVDSAGEAVPNAKVIDPYGSYDPVTTDGAGRFRCSSGFYEQVYVFADGFAVQRFARKRSADGNLRIELVRAASGTATLHGPRGQPLGRASVLWSDQLGQGRQLEQLVRTDGDGAVMVTGVGVSDTCLGFAFVDGVYVPFLPRTGNNGIVTIRPRAMAGTIVDVDGTPIAGARIVARSRDPAYVDRGDPIWVTYSDHGGRFRFASLPPGEIVLVAIAGADGFAKAEIKATDVRAALQTGKEEPFVVEVMDADEQPCKNVWVTMTSMGGPDDDYAATSASAGATLVGFTGDDGRVSFRGVPDARWLTLGMRLVGTKIEATPTVFPSRGTVTRIALSEHKR